MSRGLVVGQSAQHPVSAASTATSPQADTTGPTRRPFPLSPAYLEARAELDDLAETLRANDHRYRKVAENLARGQAVLAAPVRSVVS